jgi:hypothetical protein
LSEKSGFFGRLIKLLFVIIFVFIGLYFAHKSFVRIDPGKKAFVWTRFHGVKKKAYGKGMHFMPLRALPYVFKMIFRPETEELAIHVKAPLPYARLLPSSSKQNIDVIVKINCEIKNSLYNTMFFDEAYLKFKNNLKIEISRFTELYLNDTIIEKRLIGKKETLLKGAFKKELSDGLKAYFIERLSGDADFKKVFIHINNFPDTAVYLRRYGIIKNMAEAEEANLIKKLIELEYLNKYDAIKEEAFIRKVLKYNELKKKGYDVLPYLFIKTLNNRNNVILVPYSKKGININSIVDDLIRRESNLRARQNR